MIYVSSGCVKNKKIKDSVQELVNNGFRNIELSGGTENYAGFEDDLLELQYKYNLNYLCHNYFPPPQDHFVLNLASLDDEVHSKSFDHLCKSIELSKKLKSPKFGFHAGFFLDIKVSEIGRKITKHKLFDTNEATQRFYESYNKLNIMAGDLKLYIENNVFSSTNYKTFSGENFFMLCEYKDYIEFTKNINFNLLLDVAHLKVSSKTLNLNFEYEFNMMINNSDYIHISDNDGFHDQNHSLKRNSNLLKLINGNNLRNKDFTLEVYEDLSKIRETYEVLKEVI